MFRNHISIFLETGPTCPEYDSDLPRFRPSRNQISISPETGPTCPESDSGPCKYRGSRIRFRSFRKWGQFAHNEIPNFPDADLRKQRQIPTSPETGPTCPKSDFAASNFRCFAIRCRSFRKRGRFVQDTISISPGSDLPSIRFRSLQRQDRSVQNQIPILPETGPTCQGSDSGLSKSQFPRISSRSF